MRRSRILTAGPLSLDLDTRQAQVGETWVRAHRARGGIAGALDAPCRRALARADIFAALWAGHGGASPNVVDVYVGYLRHKLAEACQAAGI